MSSASERLDIAVIAVPAPHAQPVVDQVVAAGVKAILNFSPGALKVPAHVKLKSVDLTVSLESLSFYLAQGDPQMASGRGRRPSARLSHLDEAGKARMVDVGSKAVTSREALARGEITMSAAALTMIRTGKVAKGDPLQTARLAGIMAAKQTSVTHSSVSSPAVDPCQRRVDPDPARLPNRVARTHRRKTGVEMEALTAVSVAALTIYDMVKAVDKEMVIGDICLVEKTGGRSGHYRRSAKR